MRARTAALLLCIVVCLGLWVPAAGANTEGVTFTAALDVEELTVSSSAQTVRLSISASPAFAANSFYYDVEYPAGWKAEKIESNDENITIAEGDCNLEFTDHSLREYWVSGKTENVSGISGLGEITFTVPANTAAGVYEFKVTNFEVCKNIDGRNVTWETGSELTASVTLTEAENAGSYTVSFDPGGGTGRMENVTVKAGGYSLPECAFTAPKGKEYRAWSIDEKEYQPNAVYYVSKDTVVVALWKDAAAEDDILAVVRFHLQGGRADGITDGAEVTYTEDEEGNALPEPERSGYVFDGWFDRKTGGTRYRRVSASLPRDLYAHWSEEIAEETEEESGGRISVTFRLIGAELAEKDVDLGKSSYLPAYVTWIPTVRYELEEGATVYDLWVAATEDAGIRSVGADKNYVSTVYAPRSLGGYALSEFTNGKRSGWMYTINGKHPGYGLKEQQLEDGDRVIWHYVNDYSYEVDDWFSEGQWRALGDGTYYNGWLDAPDRFGEKSAKKDEEEAEQEQEQEEEEAEEEESEEEEAEDTGKNGSEAVVEEASVTVIAEVTEGTAEAEVTTENVTEALEENEKAEVLTVTVVSEEADSVTLTVGSDAVQTIADAEVSLNVVTDQGSVTISAEDVGSLAAENGDVAVSIKNHENGTTTVDVTVNGETADVSVKVALPAVEDGQVVVVVNEDGTEEVVRKSVVEDGTAYAELPAGTTIKIVDNAKDFDDVPADAWYADSVDFVSSHELFEGTDKGFEPSMNMTRAMLVTVLYRLENEPDATAEAVFTDVKEDSWYADAVEWAASSGIVNGVGNDLYDPNGDVTREQIATMLYRYVKHLGLDVSSRGSLDKFYDGDQVSDWAKDAMQWAVKLGIFRGDDTGSLNPKNKATRAEVATLMERIVKLLVL